MTADNEVDDQGWANVRPAVWRRGHTRSLLAGAVYALGAAIACFSLAIGLIGLPVLDFTFFFVRIASHPEPMALNGVAIPNIVALLVLVPLCLSSFAGERQIWRDCPPRLTTLAGAGWLVLALVCFLAGGSATTLPSAVLLFVLAFAGAWAGRLPGSTPLDVLLRGEQRWRITLTRTQVTLVAIMGIVAALAVAVFQVVVLDLL